MGGASGGTWVEIVEVRISHLAYAPEIAQAMLRRQQAADERDGLIDGATDPLDTRPSPEEAHNVVAFAWKLRRNVLVRVDVPLQSLVRPRRDL
jgi:hypothetical protein